jgi:succinyl-diaminopimelate desuccinylase
MLSTVLELLEDSRDECCGCRRTLWPSPPSDRPMPDRAKGSRSTTWPVMQPNSQAPGRRPSRPRTTRVDCGHRPSLIIRAGQQSPHPLAHRPHRRRAHRRSVPVAERSIRPAPGGRPDLRPGRGGQPPGHGQRPASAARPGKSGGRRTDLSLGILLAADEETGNTLGIEYIMSNIRTSSPRTTSSSSRILGPRRETPSRSPKKACSGSGSRCLASSATPRPLRRGSIPWSAPRP